MYSLPVLEATSKIDLAQDEGVMGNMLYESAKTRSPWNAGVCPFLIHGNRDSEARGCIAGVQLVVFGKHSWKQVFTQPLS